MRIIREISVSVLSNAFTHRLMLTSVLLLPMRPSATVSRQLAKSRADLEVEFIEKARLIATSSRPSGIGTALTEASGSTHLYSHIQTQS